MLKNFLKTTLKFLVTLILLAVIFLIYVNFPVELPDKKFEFGTTFSARYAQDIGLEWREVYTAMLSELQVKKLRLPVYWDLVEGSEGKMNFADLDWQIERARQNQVKIILALGKKVPRWPECFEPEWVKGEAAEVREQKLAAFMMGVVERYKNNPTIVAWQVENEPFLNFGMCGTISPETLDQEIALVRKTDPTRPIVVTDSGELSAWVPAAKRADIFGTTMYIHVYNERFGSFSYPIGPRFFHVKEWLVQQLTDNEKIINVELQAEPWLDEWTVNASVEKQLLSMNPEILRENVEFAKKAGFTEIYLWGTEWWYWMKVKGGHPEIWEAARQIYAGE